MKPTKPAPFARWMDKKPFKAREFVAEANKRLRKTGYTVRLDTVRKWRRRIGPGPNVRAILQKAFRTITF